RCPLSLSPIPPLRTLSPLSTHRTSRTPYPSCFFFTNSSPAEIYTLSYTTLFRSDKVDSDGNPVVTVKFVADQFAGGLFSLAITRSEEHTSELQSRFDLVCRLLLEKKNQPNKMR